MRVEAEQLEDIRGKRQKSSPPKDTIQFHRHQRELLHPVLLVFSLLWVMKVKQLLHNVALKVSAVVEERKLMLRETIKRRCATRDYSFRLEN